MDELMHDERAEDELELASQGTTLTLTEEGWEAADYVDPADDWEALDDGSYLSPDGTVRTWPLINPTTE